MAQQMLINANLKDVYPFYDRVSFKRDWGGRSSQEAGTTQQGKFLSMVVDVRVGNPICSWTSWPGDTVSTRRVERGSG